MLPKKPQSRRFILLGFSEDGDTRRYAYEVVKSDRTRAAIRMSANLVWARRYGIPIQDLPLFCQSLLERCPESGLAPPHINVTEEDMREYQALRTAAQAAAMEKRLSTRRMPSANRGSAWRTPATPSVG